MSETFIENDDNRDEAARPGDGESNRLLVAIASFGTKNLPYLEQVIRQYQGMALDIDIVLNTEAYKAVDPAVEVIVGLPDKNPRSLVFAHREIFASRVDEYDAFIYTEDDIGVQEQHLRAFFALTADLKPDEIAGHMRYEVAPDGTRHLPDVHAMFHWRPESVRQRGEHTVAEFTNEHAGFYILTRDQLRRAIASGGYLRDAHEGRFGMLESGATDPFTSCGFRKVLSISAFDDFLIHHIPNTYVGRLGFPLTNFTEQIETLAQIQAGQFPATTLFDVEPKILQRAWSKSYYEALAPEISEMLPTDAATALSVGCGWGAAETELMRRGTDVTVLPLDSVIGVTVGQRGAEVINGTLAEGIPRLEGRTFDCVFVSNLLHLRSDPWRVLDQCAELVASGGVLVVVGHNFQRAPQLAMRMLRIGDFGKAQDFERSGVRYVGPTRVKRQLDHAGFRLETLRWFDLFRPERFIHLRHWPGRFTRWNWIVRVRRGR